MIGELVDHYRVLELIGRGAMGVVYKALDENLDRRVAIKVMSAEARNDPDFVERFRQEARMQGALNHPNIALLFDYFIHDGTPVAVMEFIDGESLEELIRRRGPIPARESIPIFKQALRGVAAAHRAGIVHRDLKPSNLMVTGDGIVKVMDFGIAKRQGVTGATKFSSTSIGSPLYMAPEQILGRPVDCRTDIYALGITLYELLTGQRPFNARGKAEYLVLDAHVNEQPEPPTVYRYGIPQPIVDAVMRSLAKDPDARFQSADEFNDALPDVGGPAAAEPGVVAPSVPAPDVPALEAAALGEVFAAPVGPTGTVALRPAAPAPPVPPVPATGTLAVEFAGTRRIAPTQRIAPPTSPTQRIAPTQRIDHPDAIAVDFSVGTVWQQLHPPASAPPPANNAVVPPPAVAAAPSPKPSRRMPLGAAMAVAVIAVALALGALGRLGNRPHATQPLAQKNAELPIPTPPPESTEPPDPPLAKADAAPATVDTPPVATAPVAAASPPSRQDLSGSWSGEYVDASGKQLLRVVNLSISSVRGDGGIEGTLEYQAPSGNGECKLHPRGSTWSAPDRRLQLSPEGCSPHHPRELGVPLDFAGVNPRANLLKDGRIEAPTGAVIKVKLKRLI